jgi:hypothetical protein
LLGATIAAVEMYIGIKKAENAIIELADALGLTSSEAGDTATAINLAKFAVYTLAAAFAILAIAVVLAASPVILFIAILYGLYAAGQAIGRAIVAAFNAIGSASKAAGQAIVDGVTAAIDWLSSISLVDIGTALVAGLADGIVAGIGAAVSAVQNLGASVVAAMKSAVDSHSPSRLFHKIGDDGIDEGLAQGVDAGKPRVNKAVGGLVEPKPLKLGAKGGGEGKAFAPVFNNCTFGEGMSETVVRRMMWAVWSEMAYDAEPAT